MDKFGDHALVCPCRGDRTARHSQLQNAIYAEAAAAGMQPVREKPGLLPQRPSEDDWGTERSMRRPADIWLPQGQRGRGEAPDIAVTSGLRADMMQEVRDTPTAVFEKYEHLKKTHQNTEEQCMQAGFDFTPVIFEAHGGSWSLTTRRVLDRIARRQQSTVLQEGLAASLRIAQRISIALQKANARAVLRRAADISSHEARCSWALYAEDSLLDGTHD